MNISQYYQDTTTHTYNVKQLNISRNAILNRKVYQPFDLVTFTCFNIHSSIFPNSKLHETTTIDNNIIQLAQLIYFTNHPTFDGNNYIYNNTLLTNQTKESIEESISNTVLFQPALVVKNRYTGDIGDLFFGYYTNQHDLNTAKIISKMLAS